jgi:hypothetical protein
LLRLIRRVYRGAGALIPRHDNPERTRPGFHTELAGVIGVVAVDAFRLLTRLLRHTPKLDVDTSEWHLADGWSRASDATFDGTGSGLERVRERTQG